MVHALQGFSILPFFSLNGDWSFAGEEIWTLVPQSLQWPCLAQFVLLNSTADLGLRSSYRDLCISILCVCGYNSFWIVTDTAQSVYERLTLENDPWEVSRVMWKQWWVWLPKWISRLTLQAWLLGLEVTVLEKMEPSSHLLPAGASRDLQISANGSQQWYVAVSVFEWTDSKVAETYLKAFMVEHSQWLLPVRRCVMMRSLCTLTPKDFPFQGCWCSISHFAPSCTKQCVVKLGSNSLHLCPFCYNSFPRCSNAHNAPEFCCLQRGRNNEKLHVNSFVGYFYFPCSYCTP